MKKFLPKSVQEKRAVRWLVGAMFFGVAAFTMLMIGHVPYLVAVGLSIISFVGFFYCFNRGYDMWVEGRKNGR